MKFLRSRDLKNHFFTGLIILLPIALTLWILAFLFNLLTEPLAGILASLFDRYDLFENGFLFLNGAQVQEFIAQVIIFMLLFAFTVTLGMITRYFFIKYLIDLSDYILHKIPFISPIYKGCQDLINTLFSSDSKAFKTVVLVPFPEKGNYTVGFLTCDNLDIGVDKSFVAVFIPTAPNPTSGFLVLYPPDQIKVVDMKVDEAFKYVISCGVIAANFNKAKE
ncbi:MAG: DUF502 domain-containing protein [Parachlamydiaceae bacterium]